MLATVNGGPAHDARHGTGAPVLARTAWTSTTARSWAPWSRCSPTGPGTGASVAPAWPAPTRPPLSAPSPAGGWDRARTGHALHHEQVELATALLSEWLDRVRDHHAS